MAGPRDLDHQSMLRFALHPRQARLLVEAERRGVAKEGAILAALVGERDLRSSAKARFDAPGGMPRGPRAAPASRRTRCAR